MALHIVNQEADPLAREIADLTNESLSAVVVRALRERAQHLYDSAGRANLTQMREIAAVSTQKCVADRRSPEEIIGYDEQGLPG